VVRRIDVAAQGVHWSEGGSLVAIATDASFYLLEYARDVAESVLASGQVNTALCPLQLASAGSRQECAQSGAGSRSRARRRSACRWVQSGATGLCPLCGQRARLLVASPAADAVAY
jgi:hypothetical protein